MDLTNLTLPDEDRDLVIAFHVLEHITDDGAALGEIARVLRPGGIALLEVPLGAVWGKLAHSPTEARISAKPKRRDRRFRWPLFHLLWAVHMDYIVCLEDGQKVLDLAVHLEMLGMTRNASRRKWGLPDACPMQASDLIFEQGPTFEYDMETGEFRRIYFDGTFHPQGLKPCC
jgi:SAM-dependent methyltransferase